MGKRASVARTSGGRRSIADPFLLKVRGEAIRRTASAEEGELLSGDRGACEWRGCTHVVRDRRPGDDAFPVAELRGQAAALVEPVAEPADIHAAAEHAAV